MKTRDLLRKLGRSKMFMIGFFGMFILFTLCVISPAIVQHSATKSDLAMRLQPPEWLSNGFQGYVFGTDALGRDVLTRLLIGGRTSLLIAVVVIVISTVTGTVVGLISGYFGSATDRILMRICDVLLAIPSLMLAICVVAVMGTTFANLIFTLSVTSWVITARIVRASTLGIRSREYISAAKVIGASNSYIMGIEVFPNVTTPMIIAASQRFGTVILVESSMSFLGLGVPMPHPSWGTMIADGRAYIATSPWVVIIPGIALMLTVLFFNFMGDGLRDVFDPKNKD